MTDTDIRFRRSYRLLSSSEFQPVLDSPDIRVGGAHLLVLVRNATNGSARLGLIVAKRRVRHAVWRNRIKRVCRESFRLRRADLTGLDIVILVRSPLPQPDAAAVRAELERLWDKLLAKRGQA